MFHGAERRAIPDALLIQPCAMPSTALIDAYGALLSRAPAPLFARARQLYLNKYCLDGRNTQSALRLFVAQEIIEESVEPNPEEGPLGRIATLQSSTMELALVHWQRDEAPTQPMIQNYLQQCWQLKPSLITPSNESWFRNGGFQLQITLDQPLTWTRSSFYQETNN